MQGVRVSWILIYLLLLGVQVIIAPVCSKQFDLIFKKILFIYFFRERRREGERRERNTDVPEMHWSVASHTLPPGDLARNPSNSDWKSNRWPFNSQAGTQSTEPHQLELHLIFQFYRGKIFQFFYFIEGSSLASTQLAQGHASGKQWHQDLNSDLRLNVVSYNLTVET